MMKNVFAWTAPGKEYPECLSLAVRDGQIVLTVRGAAAQENECGAVAEITLPRDVVYDMIGAPIKALELTQRAAN